VLQGAGSLVATLMTFVFAYREVPVRLPNWGEVTEVLRLGWTMFLFRSSVSLYSVGNSFVLGLFAPPQVVAYYSGAEKISKAFLGFLGPITQALYPRLSYLAQSSRHEAARLAKVGVIVMALAGACMGLVIFVSASLLVRIFLGEGYDASVVVLRLLALLPPLIALSNVLGIQWMLPLGLDRPFNIIILVAGVLNLCLAVILAPHFAELGMAWAVVVSEAFVTASMYLVLRRSDLDPITYTGKAKGDI
ncbi:MAG: oligosaccharide flippase family protein, partial [Gorillibacterium sp.]|nr:oligosaccharide flippase family protein [Gorillibacterium sp.]